MGKGATVDSALDILADTFGPLLIGIAIAALLERLVPWRTGAINRLRWLHAMILTILGTVILSILFPLGLNGGVALAREGGFGVFHWLSVPLWLAIPLGFVVLDFAEYIAHLAMHKVPLLWRLHRVHHSDEEMDVSTGLRFHPIEALFRFGIGLALVLAFGVPTAAVWIYAGAALVFNIWEHANVRMPRQLIPLSNWIITPLLHRIHHSDAEAHYDRNLGIVFTLWDRIFGTFLNDPEIDPRFGLGPDQSHRFVTLGQLLGDPARR